MSIYKRVSGNLVVQTIGNTDSITFQGASANTATVVIDGNLTVTGNASLTGNIAGDKIFNGTTSIEIPTSNGNANISVGGVSNVFVTTSTGVEVAGTASATGNVTGGNIVTSGQVTATDTVTGGNITTPGNINLIRASTATTTPILRFTDSNTAVTSLGSNIGAVEWYVSDPTGAGARVTAAVKAVYADGSGNANILIQTASGASLTNRIVVLGDTGNVGVANSAPLHGFAVSGTMYGSSTLDVVGNVAGGNISTAGLVTAGGNVTGANVFTAGVVSAGGNITGANISVAGGVIGGAGGVSVTGNVTGGNLIINGTMSASGNLATTDITATTLNATGNITGGNIKTLGISNVGTSIVTGTQTVIGNITGANVNAGIVSATGNVDSLNVNTGLVSATGNIISAPGGYFVGDGGYLSNITVVSNVSVTQLASGTTNWTIRGSGGNITADIGGASNTVVFYGGGVDITGAFSAVGNVTGGNINTGGLVSATGNIIGGNISGATGTFTTVIGAANATNLTSGIVPSDRLIGQYTIDINGNSVIANTVATAAQPNITSVGILTSLSVSGNVVGGNINTAGLVSATGNVRGGNITTAGAVSATGAITGAAISGTTISGSGNVTGANINTAGLVSATGNVNGGNVNTTALSLSGNVISALNASSSITAGTTVSAIGNVRGGNVTTGGQMSATGNITGSYFIGNGSQLSGIDATSIQNGTSNVRVVSSGGNVAVGIGGTSNVAVYATTGQYVTGLISASGNVTGAYIIGNGSLLSSITGANVTGTVSSATTATSATSATTAGTVTTAAQGNITSVGTLTSLAVSGNTTSGNLSVSTGTVTVGNIVNANGNGVGNVGSSTTYFNTVFAKATSAQYADLAEKFLADQPYQPGTVLIFGGELEVTESMTYADHRVAGVVSTDPSYLMNAGLEGQYAVELALQGRVPCAVEGPVEKGDLLVSAPNGRARAAKSAQAGTIIGKSLENFNGAVGTIEIVVGRD